MLDPCDYLLESQDVLIVSDDWLDIDCDGDGIPNGYEISDNDDDGVPDYQEENNAAPNDDGISIFDVMTPNGDGVNDVFVISGIQNFPSHTKKYSVAGESRYMMSMVMDKKIIFLEVIQMEG